MTIELKWIREQVKNGRYYFSKHADQERQRDNLTISEVEESILEGRILERYENTGRGESLLVVGFSREGKPIHVVCGKRGSSLTVITIYIPMPPKFKNPFERGEA